MGWEIGGSMELGITQEILLYGFIIAVMLGAVVNKTNFCTMGAVSDWVNIGDTGRLRSWILAMVVALIGVLVLEMMEVFSLDSSRPPYRTTGLAWPRYILGGLMFGVGMTLASGCGNKTLVRIGAGNIKSIVVLLIAGVFAYLMTKTDFYGVMFHSWMNPLTIDLSLYGFSGQDFGSIAAGITGSENVVQVRTVVGSLIAVAALVVILKTAGLRDSFDNMLGGIAVGVAVLAAWYVTAGPMGQTWQEEVEFMDEIPLGVGSQSFTFINPMGELLDYGMNSFNQLFLTFGLVSLIGVIVGSFIYAISTKNFRIEWFVNFKDFLTHAIGAVLMGIGGVLAMGCTIGQGVTGVSTLAIGSFMAMISIIIGCAMTMKIQFYKMVYEEEATFGKAFITGLVDLKLLPSSMRKLDAV